MGFSQQEHWSGLPRPPPGELPDPGIKPTPPVSLALQVDSLHWATWSLPRQGIQVQFLIRDLRSHMPQSVAKKENSPRKILTDVYWVFPMNRNHVSLYILIPPSFHRWYYGIYVKVKTFQYYHWFISTYRTSYSYVLFFSLNFIEVYLIYNVVLIYDVQQSVSVMHKEFHILVKSKISSGSKM